MKRIVTSSPRSEKKYLQLNDIDGYVISYHLSNFVWNVVKKWDYFARDTVGKQFVRAVDSISANIAEGFGRYSKKDKVRFYYYSYGSIKESLDWNEKSMKRGLLSEKEYEYIFQSLTKLPREVHSLINFTKERLAI